MQRQGFGDFGADELARLDSAKLYNGNTSLSKRTYITIDFETDKGGEQKQNLEFLNVETLSREATTTCRYLEKTLAIMLCILESLTDRGTGIVRLDGLVEASPEAFDFLVSGLPNGQKMRDFSLDT